MKPMARPMTDLRAMMDALAADLPFAAVSALLQLGVPASVVGQLTADGDLAVAGVELSRDGNRFEIGGPTRRLLLAVRNGAGEVVDVAALSSSCEDEWALMLGVADLLGEGVLEDTIAADRREVRLFSTPMAWLRAGGRGICVLDWSKTALGALRGLRSHQRLAVDPGARPKLEGLLAYGGLPIVVEDRSCGFRRAA